MKRRELAQVAAGTALAHSFVTVMGCQAQPQAKTAADDKPAHDHEKNGSAPSPVSAELAAVATAAGTCLIVGETCLEHCIRSLSGGSTMMADCARQVQQMLAVCGAMSKLAAMGSDYASDLVALCKKACEGCTAACEEHADHHAECKACLDACRAVIGALDALA